jgi:hypothetical protein
MKRLLSFGIWRWASYLRWIFAVISIVRKKRGVETKYDERQEFARGKAYRLGFTDAADILRGRGHDRPVS